MTSLFALLIVLIILIFIHELGHFLMAKWTGCRVDEFAVGFKPALFEKKWRGTNYVLGIIPIGGYVKIWGENGSEEVENDKKNPIAFYNRPRPYQALVLFGGVLFNFILAWLLFSFLLIQGTKVSQTKFPDSQLQDARVVAVSVLSGYPAKEAGIDIGDIIISIEADNKAIESGSESFVNFIKENEDKELLVTFKDRETQEINKVTIETKDYQDRAIAGMVLDDIGIVKLPIIQALISGAVMTWDFTVNIMYAFVDLISGLFTGNADTSNLAGPVGIASIAGDSFSAGVNSFIWFLAVLSLNLAIFNLLPIPALDGGRLAFVAIESVIRRPINPKWFMYVNVAGFVFLLGLMLLVTVFDIAKLF